MDAVRPTNMVALLVSSVALLSPNTWELNAFLTKMGYKKEAEASVGTGVRLDYVRMSPAVAPAMGQGGGSSRTVSKSSLSVRNEVQFIASSGRLSQSPAWKALKHTHHLESTYLGLKEGVHYYAFAPIPESLSVQKQLNLQGGVNWQWLAAKGTVINDEGRYTANSCVFLFKEGDDTGVQHLMTFATQNSKDSWYSVLGLGNVPTKQATAQLISLYKANSEDFRKAAAYALIHEPLRKEAKAEYIDMLYKGLYVEHAAKAASDWGWGDALPALQMAIDKPESPMSLVAAIEAERKLSGKPIPENVLTAGRLSAEASAQQISLAKSTLTAYSDKEVVAAYAYRYTLSKGKASPTALAKMGQEVLNLLSEEDREWVLSKFRS